MIAPEKRGLFAPSEFTSLFCPQQSYLLARRQTGADELPHFRIQFRTPHSGLPHSSNESLHPPPTCFVNNVCRCTMHYYYVLGRVHDGDESPHYEPSTPIFIHEGEQPLMATAAQNKKLYIGLCNPMPMRLHMPPMVRSPRMSPRKKGIAFR